jgi:hypothetical protein
MAPLGRFALLAGFGGPAYWIHLHLDLFDDLEPLVPQDHGFPNEKVSWLHVDEHLPQSG